MFVYDKDMLMKLRDALSKGNEWAYDASMIIAVFSRQDLDCVIKERIYYLFDTGMATALLILRATELGLVAHPIAGFREKKVKEILEIPEAAYDIVFQDIVKVSAVVIAYILFPTFGGVLGYVLGSVLARKFD